MTTQNQNNLVTLTGCMAKEDDEEPAIIFSHEVNGEKFFSFTMGVERISGTKDYLPIIVSERLIGKNRTYIEGPLCVKGQFRSYNMKDGTKAHLKLYVFALDIFIPEEADSRNDANITGFICKNPVYRHTPMGREVTDLMLAVPRVCGKSDYIPCICWGRNAVYASQLPVGAKVTVSGRIQSREFQKQVDSIIEHRTAYELSISQICEE